MNTNINHTEIGQASVDALRKITLLKNRHIPENYIQYSPDLPGYAKDLFAAYVTRDDKDPRAMFFVGKQSNPIWHYRFPNLEAMKTKLNTQISTLMSWEDMKADRKEKNKARLTADMDAVAVGGMFSYSWGWEQTNVEFFQVIEKKSKSFVMQEIRGRMHPSEGLSSMAGYVSAVKGAFVSDAKPIAKTSFSMPYGILSKTESDERHYSSWYA
jgi:hypothetical protein